MESDFDGRTALVTGASENIGRGIAVKLAEWEADAGVAAHTDREGYAETARRVEASGGRSATAPCDLADPSDVESMVEATPLERTGEIDEVAEACCFLAPERASFVTGQTLHVNGGTYPTPTLVSRERS